MDTENKMNELGFTDNEKAGAYMAMAILKFAVDYAAKVAEETGARTKTYEVFSALQVASISLLVNNDVAKAEVELSDVDPMEEMAGLAVVLGGPSSVAQHLLSINRALMTVARAREEANGSELEQAKAELARTAYLN